MPTVAHCQQRWISRGDAGRPGRACLSGGRLVISLQGRCHAALLRGTDMAAKDRKPAATAAQKAPLIDDPSVHEAFGDSVASLSLHGQVVPLAFAAHRPSIDEAGTPVKKVTARVALTLDAAVEMHRALSTMFRRL